MVAKLVRRLLLAGVVSRDTLAQALLNAATSGRHVLQVLGDGHSDIIAMLETELARDKGPSLTLPLAIDYLQVLRLPSGLCKRLLTVPLRVEPTRSRWAVAVADLTDPHVVTEISYHLGGPVDVFRAPLGVILDAVSSTEERPLEPFSLPLLDVDDKHTPAFGTPAIIPLRRPSARFKLGDDAPVEHRPTLRRGLSVPPAQSAESPSEPPIPLVRPIAHRSAEKSEARRVTSVEPPASRDARPRQTMPQLYPASPSVVPPEKRISEILAELDDKQSPREVLLGFGRAVSTVAKRVAVFAVRSGRFELEYRFPANSAPKLSVSGGDSSVLQMACQSGYYLGPLTRGANADSLAEALAVAKDSEIYVVPVVVAERPAVLLVAGLIDNTFAATRAIDHIAARGREILEQLARRRRHR